MNQKTLTYSFLLLLIIFISSCGEKPDIIYTNGKIYTLNSSNAVVEAVAVKEGKILDAGTSSEIADKYKAEETVDLHGAVVLPGFIDSDGSIIEFSKNLNFMNLSFVKSIEEMKNLVIEKTKNTNEGEWIGGYGWSELNIPEEQLETMDREILDKIAPNYNVFLINSTFTTAWVNSRALRYLKIDKNTPNPEDGEIEKDADGEPTGLLFDNAVNLIKDNLPGLLKGEMMNQVERGVKEIIKYGITEVHDRTVSKLGLEVFKELIDAARFPLKVYAILSAEDSSLVEQYLKSGAEINYKDKLTIRSLSLDYDGLFELQDAVMNDDYKSDPKKKIPYVTTGRIESVFSLAIDKNFQFCIKAIGDRGVDSSLFAIEKVLKQKNPKDPRTILEYCEFLSPRDLSKMEELKIIPSVRPDVCMNDFLLYSQLINSEVGKKLGLWNSIIKSTGMITTGSDFPFHQINPFVQIYYLTTRQFTDTVSASIPNPDQKISLLDAVKSYTVWPAYSSFEESTKGSIEKGKYADMIVISNDIMNGDSKRLLETKVLKTIINGKIVYDESTQRK